MMADPLSTTLRQLVFDRANGRCEYCLLAQSVSAHKHEPDHIIPRQHDGETTAGNLALACARCNRYKGYNVGSYDPESGELVPFYNPRRQEWSDHFRLEGASIAPLTPEGWVTAKMLHFNDANRIEERERLMAVDLYP
ncbi:MAG: HNH endonuclease [Anaerolineae bacterium]|nr:HNH endonuclease [Anaerolineae bacterium]